MSLHTYDRAEVVASGKTTILPLPRATLNQVPRSFVRWIRREPTDGAVATLEIARQHALAVSGAMEATPIRDVPPEYVDRIVESDGGSTISAIRGIEAAFERCAESSQLLSDSGLMPWAGNAGRKSLIGYRHFSGLADA
jgi:hypothetical protein